MERRILMKTRSATRSLARSGIAVALALALSYLKIPIGAGFGGFGGSVDLVMIPLIVLGVMDGLGWGLGAGLVFGLLKFFLAGGVAINWESMLLDYVVAYAFVGFAGLFRGKYGLLPVAALVGCLARFVVHFISGITIYAIVAPEEILWLTTSNSWLYSLLYNGSYMLPNTVLAVFLCALLIVPVRKLANSMHLT